MLAIFESRLSVCQTLLKYCQTWMKNVRHEVFLCLTKCQTILKVFREHWFYACQPQQCVRIPSLWVLTSDDLHRIWSTFRPILGLQYLFIIWSHSESFWPMFKLGPISAFCVILANVQTVSNFCIFHPFGQLLGLCGLQSLFEITAYPSVLDHQLISRSS